MTYTDRFLRSYVPKHPLTTYTFTYQLDGEAGVRQETFIWYLSQRRAFACAWRTLRNRHPNILWMEC